jgi:hypothetical protein
LIIPLCQTAFPSYMRKNTDRFSSAKKLADLITQYFLSIEDENTREEKDAKPIKSQTSKSKQKLNDRQQGPATVAGLAFYLGFNSRQDFEDYQQNGKFGSQLARATLQIEATYEKKLHYQSPTGAIFALKSMGWNETAGNKPEKESVNKILRVEIIQSGPPLASSENEIIL